MIAPPSSRNDPCPCGSGMRYKHCHGRAEGAAPPAAAAPTVADESARGESPQRVDALRRLGNALATADPARAETCWHDVLAHVPGDAEASFQLGNLARAAGRADDAVAWFERALAGAPGHTGVLNNLGLALETAGRIAEAEPIFRRALAAAPAAFEPLANLAQNLYRQRRYADALPHFDALLARMPDAPATLWANRSVCQSQLGRLDEAEAGLRRALALTPGEASLYRDLGIHAIRMKRYDAAVELLSQGVALRAGDLLTESLLLAAELNTARWDRFDAASAAQIEAAKNVAEQPGQSLSAFTFAVICDDPALQQQAARSWSRTEAQPARAPATRVRPAAAPLRLGFVSSDFYNHPVGRLIVGLLERIDRTRFSIATYSVAAPCRDEFTQRIEAAADMHRSAQWLDPDAMATTIRDDAIDVLFDMNGLTGIQLTGIFALRPAPIQAGFIGYTGTLGSCWHDWIIADRYCIGESERTWYDEMPVYVEPCYLPSDPARTLATDTMHRADYGLPERGVVFCAFAPLYKILPAMFAQWMRLLARHPDSVLWLRAAPESVAARLRGESQARGVDGARLVFAPDEPLSRYLARFRLADLFLDTHPFGAHTTVNDALYAGLPVVTIGGRSFAGRASASQVDAAGCAAMIAHDHDHYFAIADALAAAPSRLAGIAASLRAAAPTSALFDLRRHTRAFESALEAAWAVSSGRHAREQER